MSYRRPCPCPHSDPLCACSEGLSGPALDRRSNFLSSLAGWPGQVDPADAAAVLAAYGRPAPPIWLALPRLLPRMPGEATGPEGCGCGRA